MAALPYMPLFVADYLADTAHLSTLEHGAYLLLLMNYWQRGEGLPDDDKKLAKIARLGPREWLRVRDTLSEFFQIADGTWLNSRVEHELARVHDKSLKSKAAAQASVQRRFGKRSADVEPTDTQAHTDKKKLPTVVKKTGGLPAQEPPSAVPEDLGLEDAGDLTMDIAKAWNAMAGPAGLATVIRLTDKRTRALRMRIKAYGAPAIFEAIGKIPGRPFLLGRNKDGWKADFDFLIQPDTVAKILEGRYANGGSRTGWGSTVDAIDDWVNGR